MLSKSAILALAASLSTVSGAIQGFNYGATGSDGSTPFVQSDYEAQFNAAKTLVGHSGFNSARLYTMIQAGGDNSAISQAIPAAVNTGTKLLLGMWGSGGQEGFSNELAVFKAAVQQYGTKFTDLIQAISVGSEDLYRISPTGIKNKSGVGAGPDVLVDYINQLRSSMKSMGMTKPIMHVDTWTAWVNDSNSAVVDAVDVIGTDAYPYFQTTMSNGINVGKQLFFDAYDATVAHAKGKDVWITETGWPVSGKTENLAVPSLQNAKTYWDQVACQVLGKINTYWYTLQDTDPSTPNPSFGIVGYPVSNKPKYDLTCPAGSPGAEYNGKGASHSSLPSYESKTEGKEPKTESNVVYSTHWLTVTSSPAVYGHTTTSTMTFYETVTCDECAGSSYPQPTGYPTGVSATPTGKSPASGTCPTNLSGPYQTPHLIVPVNSEQPTRAYGTQYNGQVSSTMSTVFNFDIPESYSGSTCTLVFLFPQKEQLETSSYTMSGQGGIDVKKLKAPATQSTTYENCPAGEHVGGVSDLQPGNSYAIYSGPCAAGETVSYEFSGTGSLDVNFFEDWNPSPLGCFITAC